MKSFHYLWLFEVFVEVLQIYIWRRLSVSLLSLSRNHICSVYHVMTAKIFCNTASRLVYFKIFMIMNFFSQKTKESIL